MKERVPTERERAQKLLAAIVESSDDAIVSKDLAGRILTWNPAAERLFGYTSEEAVGQSIRLLLPPERADDFFSILDRIRQGERVEHYETVRRRKDGSLVEVSLTVSPVHDDDGMVVAASKIARDLTAVREVQRERERMREMFLATLGHDLRNPLNTITISLAYLQKHIPQSLRHVTTRMSSSANRMARMIEQLLDFTRARLGGGIPISPRPADLREICASVIDELQAQHPDRLRLTAEGEFRGQWDTDRLAQVFGNLLGNALEHGSPATPVDVRLGLENGVARIDVENRGATIPADLREEIFEPFRRVGRDTSRTPTGVGLGLYITREIVRAHGGTIEMTSEGDRTTFTLRLPLRTGSS